MANANKAKMAELEETLMASLRDAVAGRDVESSSFSDDEVTTIEAIMQRLSLLVMSKDLVETLEDEEGGQSSGWEIVFAFAERGKLGYDVEIKVCARGPFQTLLITLLDGRLCSADPFRVHRLVVQTLHQVGRREC